MKIKATLVLLVLTLICSFGFNNIDPELFTAFNTIDQGQSSKVYALKLPEVFFFSEEEVPLEAPDIRERFDKELLVNTYWQSNMMLLLKRANKWFPTIEAILKEEGVPEDFKYLAVIESGLENVRSPKGAKGFWQLMPGTAKEYGLEVNTNVDERYHVEKSTRVACAYLIKAKERFGSWTLAAASYNRGMYGTQRLLDNQLVDNYYDLLLNTETSRYVFRILAVKEIMSHPERYGFIFEDSDLYQPVPVKKIGWDVPIANIAEFAKEKGVNYKVLKIHNPWLIENHLNNKSRKYYEIELPEEGFY
ncbi:MAG: lytic transglycosylase domain-containing protein [Flavobacteriaceae bacterium]